MGSPVGFKNEDSSVLRSVRVTIQVRAEKVTMDIRSSKGEIYPSIVVGRREARRSKESDPLTTALVALQKAIEALPGAVEDSEGSPGEEW